MKFPEDHLRTPSLIKKDSVTDVFMRTLQNLSIQQFSKTPLRHCFRALVQFSSSWGLPQTVASNIKIGK